MARKFRILKKIPTENELRWLLLLDMLTSPHMKRWTRRFERKNEKLLLKMAKRYTK